MNIGMDTDVEILNTYHLRTRVKLMTQNNYISSVVLVISGCFSLVLV